MVVGLVWLDPGCLDVCPFIYFPALFLVFDLVSMLLQPTTRKRLRETKREGDRCVHVLYAFIYRV